MSDSQKYKEKYLQLKNKYNDVRPNAMFLEENTITFPCYDGVDVSYIVGKIKEYKL